ncbi:hypothetical protein FHR81_002931 [Actinoalloteichus hoggarensis]|uniref:hypothetical protein n=1 Tax=Actinoalloteichus hoggarensis TaxID=1470176 RepID=UPI0012FDCC8E|nr:hypothetical protein [Actinoalloteichus hoggarensis]MBB5921891.1 hypothetical protein [Actinoalloteichus hoggarensis]
MQPRPIHPCAARELHRLDDGVFAGITVIGHENKTRVAPSEHADRDDDTRRTGEA